MVEFLSFFFMLTTGLKPVELTVTPPVVRVEALLDGQQIATLTSRPWVFTCELGPEPRPWELIAIGHDVDGREVDRAVQWGNLGVQSARSRMSFEEDRIPQSISLGEAVRGLRLATDFQRVDS